jgi:hypothetical protein
MYVRLFYTGVDAMISGKWAAKIIEMISSGLFGAVVRQNKSQNSVFIKFPSFQFLATKQAIAKLEITTLAHLCIVKLTTTCM